MRLMDSRYSGQVQPGIAHAPSFMSDALVSDDAWAAPSWWQRSQCKAARRRAGRINTARALCDAVESTPRRLDRRIHVDAGLGRHEDDVVPDGQADDGDLFAPRDHMLDCP